MHDPLPHHAVKALPEVPDAATVALTRLGFGPSPQARAEFEGLGASDAQRFAAWIDRQLAPASIDDSACDARVAQSGFTTLGKSLNELWTQHLENEEWQIRMQPFYEVTLQAFVRAIHSRRQLFELMVDFWHNHFNVFGDDVPFGPLWAHYDREAIRANALGNFREMLEDVATSPVMLFYLDNAYNSQEDPNENFAREALELHTLGADAYYGSIPPDQVPTDASGLPLGYTEDDVVEAARCLTGWTIETSWVWWQFDDTGEFLYYDEWHDSGAKSVMGLDLPPGQGPMQDGRDLFDHLTNHPATARFISLKIARRLMADSPPDAVVAAAAETFRVHVASPDQIARVVRTILEHPAFLETWGDKAKRPFETVVSMYRGLRLDLPFTVADWRDGLTGWFLWEYFQTSQPLFGWHPPNGYPDVKFAWIATSPRVMTWRIANMLLGIWNEATEFWYFDLFERTPPSVRSPEAIVDHWSGEVLGRALPAGERQPLVSFMAQGADPTEPLDWNRWVAGERLRAAVAMILMSPTFLFK
ncbi:MAG: DUF1800 domain-containing protein [Acidobacteriota bacterium]